jgi:hypothetical protein
MITEIISGLWIGNLQELNNTEFFNDNKISIIINCTNNHYVSQNYSCEKIRVPVSELNEPSHDFVLLKQNLPKIIKYIYQHIDTKNICILGYDNLTIPVIIVSVFIHIYGNIPKHIIIDILRSKNKELKSDTDISYFI